MKKSTKSINNRSKSLLEKIILIVFFVILVCLIMRPIQSFGEPVAIESSKNANGKSRYSQLNSAKEDYVDANGKRYNVAFEDNSEEENLWSYEDICRHRNIDLNSTDADDHKDKKDTFMAEMKKVTHENYEDRYRKLRGLGTEDELPQKILSVAKGNDATISRIDDERLVAVWQSFTKVSNFRQIEGYEEVVLESKTPVFNDGDVIVKTQTKVLYKRNANVQTVENGGVQAGVAYLMASTKWLSSSWDADKIQQAIWVINGEVDDVEKIPEEYNGLNPEADVTGKNAEEEAMALNNYVKKNAAFKAKHKVDGVETEIYDNMLKKYNGNSNYYESEVAGLVAYDEAQDEFVVGPFSIDYIRSVYVPLKGGQSENSNNINEDENSITINSIVDADVYGLDSNGNEVKLNDWNFVYPDVEYDLKQKTAVRIAQTNAINNHDTSPNIYPYPNETFYISFRDSNIDAITKLEFKTNNINAEAEAYLYEGKYYNVSWKAVVDEKGSHLQMTPTWEEIKSGKVKGTDAADVYQIKSARIIMEEKIIQLSVGNFHEKYGDYCIPLTMEFAGNVWYDGTEVEGVKDSDKVFGVRDKDENGVPDVYVHLYDENGNRVSSTVTDSNGDYIFEYVKIGPKYYIEFQYDGMKYKSTTYLNGEPDATNYYDPNHFLEYLDYSHAKESSAERMEYNNSFTEIKNGKTRTTGQAISDKGNTKDISYTTQNYDENYIGGTADIDRYDISARTKNTGLIYPLQNSYIITSKDISEVDPNQNYLRDFGIQNTFVLGRLNLATNQNYVVNTKQGDANKDIAVKDNFETEQTISYTMVDEYLHHINLGLIERAPIDFATKIDLIQSNFTLLNEVSDANIADFGKRSREIDSFDITARSNIANEKYFEERYTQNVEYDEYIMRHDFTNNRYSIENDNLQLYLKYRITLRNQSEVTSGYITELANYYDENLYYPVDSNEIWRYYDKETNYVDNESWIDNDRKGYGNIVIPQVTTYASWATKNVGNNNRSELGQIKWSSNSKFGAGNNRDMKGTNLRAMYTNSLQSVILGPGESVDIYIVYKVELKENNSIENLQGLYISNDNAGGGKKNIVEINSYKSLNIDSTNGGRVDVDSAPGNTELNNYITYEDNIDEAPYISVLVDGRTQGKSISGYVWEDLADARLGEPYFSNYDNNQRRGNGRIDINDMTGESMEKYINNVLAELIRLEYNPETQQYEQVEFTDSYKKAYPEKFNQVYPLTNETLAKDSTQILTWTGPYSGGYDTGRPLFNGQYRFDNLVVGGKYKVRFTYGTEKELRTEVTSDKVYDGQDYKSTKYKGRMDIENIADPSTEVNFVIDSYDINDANNSSVIDLFKNLSSQLKNTNNNIKFNIYSYGKDRYRLCANFDEVAGGSRPDTTASAYEAIYVAGEELISSGAANKVMIVYNDGKDPQFADSQVQIANLLRNGVTVIGISTDVEGLEIYKVSENGEKVKAYILNQIGQDVIYNIIMNKLIETYYLSDERASHSEDCLQNESYYTMEGNLKNVTGRLEVMKYSQNMNPEIADSLNIDYMKTLDQDFSENSELSLALRKLAQNTQMTADSYVVSINFSDAANEEKILNLGLQEIPKRDVEVTNQVDNIAITLSDGTEIINLKHGLTQNVQEFKDKLFTIYLDKEIMQGSTIDVTYKVSISNIGDVDTLYSYVEYATDAEKREWYEALTGNTVPDGIDINDILIETEPIKITKLYSFYDDLIFRAEDNNRWEIVNRVVDLDDSLQAKRDEITNHIKYLDDVRENIRYDDSVIWRKVTDLETLNRNKALIEKYPIVETTSLKDVKLYPSKSKEVKDGQVSAISTYLVLSKTISAQNSDIKDVLSYKNFMEIISTSSNTGRRDYNGAEGNFTGHTYDIGENDIDDAEVVTLLPPFGDKKIMIALIISASVILGIGIVFIKKKILQ